MSFRESALKYVSLWLFQVTSALKSEKNEDSEVAQAEVTPVVKDSRLLPASAPFSFLTGWCLSSMMPATVIGLSLHEFSVPARTNQKYSFVNLISNGLGKSFFPPKGGHTSILLLTSWWVFFLETVLVFSSGWPQTFSAPPASAFWMLGLQVCTLLLASMNLL